MRKLDVTNHQWRKLRKLVLARDPFCVYCGTIANTVDHVLPLKHGGESTLDNLVGACERCNYSKGARPRPTQHTQSMRRSSSRTSILMRHVGTSGPPAEISLPASSDRSRTWTLSPKEKESGN